jgi:hypothetical protein
MLEKTCAVFSALAGNRFNPRWRQGDLLATYCKLKNLAIYGWPIHLKTAA